MTLIISKDADFSRVAAQLLPTTDWSTQGLQAIFDLSAGDVGAAIRNLAPGKPNARWGGTTLPPATVGANYVRLVTNSTWMDTEIADSNNLTMMAWCKWGGTTGFIPVSSNLPGPANNGLSEGTSLLAFAGLPNFSIIGAFSDGSSVESVGPGSTQGIATLGNWGNLIGQISGQVVSQLCYPTDTSADTATATNPRALGPKFRIGSFYSSLNAGNTIDLAFYMHWNRAISAPEIAAVKAQIDPYLADRGITL